MAGIERFQLAVPDERIEELHQRLKLSQFPDELVDARWDLGSPLADIKRLATYWRDGFDWRKAEAKINELPQYQTTIKLEGFQPLKIHFVHQTSPVKGAIPLLFCHGWPGSFLEVAKILPLLAAGDGLGKPAFHVVAPSLPNFGFSEGVKKRGFSLAQYAETCHNLMQKLGYREYVTQGGDWGYMITRVMGLRFPESCKANHINLIRGNKPKFLSNPILALQHALLPYSERDKKGFARTKWFAEEGSGYNREQSTKPQTLGYTLADSPIGLLSWIYEKLHDWTDGYPWTDDEILTWISIYAFSTAGPAASVRIYYETQHNPPPNRETAAGYIPNVKLGLAHFPQELSVVPHTWAGTMGDVVYQSDNERGGHFATWENPNIIARDLMIMFGKGGGAYGVVKDRDGYEKIIA